MSTVALPAQYIPTSTAVSMYGGGGQGTAPQAHSYDPSKLYDSAKIYDSAKFYDSAKMYDSSKIYDTAKTYDNITSGNTTAAAYTIPWQSTFKYDALPPNWPTAAAANATNSWYGHQTPGLSIGHIVKPELQDYTRFVYLNFVKL